MTAAGLAPSSVPAALALGVLLPIGWVLAHLPARAALWIGRRLGDLGWWVLVRRRGVAVANLRRAFGDELSAAALDRLARHSFRHLGMNVAEVCVLLFRPHAATLARMELVGHDHLEQAAARGKGILLLSAHLGNWELLASSHALTRFPLSIVVRPLDEPLLQRLAERFRRRSGVELIGKRRALHEIVEALQRGRMVGVLLDQNSSRSEGVFVPFFRVPASTSKGLALLSLRTGAPVVPVFIRRVDGGRHRVEVDAAVPVPPDRDVLAYTAAFTRVIEAAIRRTPEQWFWMHDRWRTRPRPELS
jgi:Kdo2-lipid IVA lauroyltransferase/acyltransferase